MIIDLRARRAIGRCSPAMGADGAFWKTVIFQVLLSVMGASVGVTELHCACIAQEEHGLLLAGRSGCGKSTLALALAQTGFAFLSDDRTYFSEHEGRLLAWGLPTLLKLRPDALALFPAIKAFARPLAWNNESAFQVDPSVGLGLKRARRCEPRVLIYLERLERSTFELSLMPRAEAAARLEEDLLAEEPGPAEKQLGTIASLVEIPCWRLEHGGNPADVAQEIGRRWRTGQLAGTAHRSLSFLKVAPGRQDAGHKTRAQFVSERSKIVGKRQDPLRRFVPTPLATDLAVMGRTIRLETNSCLVLDQMVRLFDRYTRVSGGPPEFLWKIVTEGRADITPPWPEISAFSEDGLRLISIGQHGFLGVDLESREALGILAGALADDEGGFISPFLDDLFCMTSGALRLVSLSAACVALGGKGLLVFGPPNSGKTTSSYLAARQGLEFHADQTVFLEAEPGKLLAWGDFLPAAFRLEALQFLPELEAQSRPFRYRDLTFLYMDKKRLESPHARPVIPQSCVFLERHAAPVPRLTPLSRADFCRLLAGSNPFKDDQQFEGQRSAVLRRLRELPAYRLAYGADPGGAAAFYRNILTESCSRNDSPPP